MLWLGNQSRKRKTLNSNQPYNAFRGFGNHSPEHKPQLVLPSSSCSTAFSPSSKIQVFIFSLSFIFHSIVRYIGDIQFSSSSLKLGLVFWPGLGDPSTKILCFSFSRKDFGLCQEVQCSVSCTILRSPFPPSHAYSNIPLEPVCCVLLLHD